MRVSSKVFLILGMMAGAMPTAHSTTTIVPPGSWGAMQLVAGPAPGLSSDELVYEFTVTPDQPLTITNTFTVSGYAPNAYEAGFVSPGWFYVRRACTSCGAEGNVIWDMGKPYTQNFNAAYTMILVGDAGRGSEVADYTPGATYRSTLTWNRPAGKIDINISGPGLNVTRQVASSGDTITGLVFRGPDYHEMGASSFGNVAVIAQAVPEPGTAALFMVGLAIVGYLAAPRRG